MKNIPKRGIAVQLGALLLCLLVAAVLFTGVRQVTVQAEARGARLLKDAIVKAVVLCYAAEGFYPPSLTYIEQHYNVKIDRARYLVWYDVFAPNVMPVVQVIKR